jgi:hypothetical protein
MMNVLEKKKLFSKRLNKTMEVKGLVYRVKLIAKFLRINSCFVISICAFNLIKKIKLSATFNIGVKFSSSKKFTSHAWISINEEPILEDKNFIKKFKIINSIVT